MARQKVDRTAVSDFKTMSSEFVVPLHRYELNSVELPKLSIVFNQP